MESHPTLLKGGDSGPAVVPGKVEESGLLDMIAGRLTIEETPEGLCRLTGKDTVEDAFIAAVGGEEVDQLSWYETSSG